MKNNSISLKHAFSKAYFTRENNGDIEVLLKDLKIISEIRHVFSNCPEIINNKILKLLIKYTMDI